MQFITKYNDAIDIIPGYRKQVYGQEPALSERTFMETLGKPVHITGIDKDVYTFSVVMDFMKSLNLLPSEGYEDVLDIGGREGIHAALFRGLHAKRMTCNDLVDGRDPELSRKLMGFVRKIRSYRLRERLFLDLKLGNRFYRRLRPTGIVSPRLFNRFGATPSRESYYGLCFKRRPDVDEFLIGSFFDMARGPHDLVLSFLTLSNFSYRLAAAKVADLLVPGGRFVFISRYHWGPGRLTGMSADFPYLDKRLELDDIERYYKEHSPDEAPFVRQAWNMFDPERPSVRTLIDGSTDAGLRLLGYRRLMLPMLSDTAKYVADLERLNAPAIDPKPILRDISRFRSDIHLEDLQTSYIMMAFEKPRSI